MRKLLMAATVAVTFGTCQMSSAVDFTTGAKNKQDKVHLVMGVGQIDKANYTVVWQGLHSVLLGQGIEIEPGITEGSGQSVKILCASPDQMQGMVGQRDAVADVLRDDTACASRLSIIGDPLVPYYAYLIVKATNAADSIYGLAEEAGQGKFISVYAGDSGSGQRVTFRNIMRYDNKLSGGLSFAELPTAGVAADALRNSTIGAVFLMDDPSSTRVHEFLDAASKTGECEFKVLKINLSGTLTSGFYGTVKDWAGARMYNECRIPDGVTTLCVDDLLLIDGDFVRQHPGINKTIGRAASDTLAARIAKTGTQAGWDPQDH